MQKEPGKGIFKELLMKNSNRIDKFLEKLNHFTDLPLTVKSRVLILIAVVSLLMTYAFPLYRMTLNSNFYPDGLVLDIYSHKLESGDHGRHLKEINVLNHYIGMKHIQESDFPELTWLPLAIGILSLLALRLLIMGRMSGLIDLVVLLSYLAGFSFYRFYIWLYNYGHDLSPQAAMKIEGFTPPLIGFRQIANFGVTNMPRSGAVFLGVAAALLVAAIFFSRTQKISEE